MAAKSEYREDNLSRVRALLDDIDVFIVDEMTADIYG